MGDNRTSQSWLPLGPESRCNRRGLNVVKRVRKWLRNCRHCKDWVSWVINIFFCLDTLSAGLHFCTRYWFRASSLDRLDLYQVYLKMGLKILLYSGEGICDTPFHATNYFLFSTQFFQHGIDYLTPPNFDNIDWLSLEVSHDPPVLFFTSTNYPTRHKDTVQNIRATKEFTVNIISEPFLRNAIATSINAPPEVSEWPLSGLTKEPSVNIEFLQSC